MLVRRAALIVLAFAVLVTLAGCGAGEGSVLIKFHNDIGAPVRYRACKNPSCSGYYGNERTIDVDAIYRQNISPDSDGTSFEIVVDGRDRRCLTVTKLDSPTVQLSEAKPCAG